MKHTNMMKGWQPRYFRLEPKQAILSYYIVSIDTKMYCIALITRPYGESRVPEMVFDCMIDIGV